MCEFDYAALAPVKIKRNGIRFDVGFEDVLELVERDRSRAVAGEGRGNSQFQFGRTESGGNHAYTSKYWKAT